MSRRCAIYARYSSDLQRETSIEDQLRRCREHAARQIWPIVEEWVVADRAVSAGTGARRGGLQRLVAGGKGEARPVATLLVGGNSPPALRLFSPPPNVMIL